MLQEILLISAENAAFNDTCARFYLVRSRWNLNCDGKIAKKRYCCHITNYEQTAFVKNMPTIYAFVKCVYCVCLVAYMSQSHAFTLAYHWINMQKTRHMALNFRSFTKNANAINHASNKKNCVVSALCSVIATELCCKLQWILLDFHTKLCGRWI